MRLLKSNKAATFLLVGFIWLTNNNGWLSADGVRGHNAATSSSSADDLRSSDWEPNPPLSSVPSAVEPKLEKRGFLSATLGSNMVLQRDREAVLWGYSRAGRSSSSKGCNNTPTIGTIKAVMHTTNDPKSPPLVSVFTQVEYKGGNGGATWRILLPPQKASDPLSPRAITVSSATTGESAILENILFGDVYLCGGQSNMAFELPRTTNGTEEALRGNEYPHIRVFTVGQGTRSRNRALYDLQTVKEPWSVAGNHSLYDRKSGIFSSVCWFFGREVSQGLDNKIPIGLISSNWGGTKIELWQPGGDLYNAMIHPFLPMSLVGFTWYQGEANIDEPDAYSKSFPHMIQQWREGFHIPEAYFGFVQLSTWCPKSPLKVAETRQAQMAALKLKGKIGFATNADHGFGCNVHPPDKQFCGARLGQSALALQYEKKGFQWKSPTYQSASAGWDPSKQKLSATIVLKDVLKLSLLKSSYNSRFLKCQDQLPWTCAGAMVLLNGKGWVNATVTVQGSSQLSFEAEEGAENDQIIATSYGWGSVPLMTIYDSTGLPVLPWRERISQTFGPATK